MKFRRIVILAAGLIAACSLTSCMNQNYIMLEDDGWGIEEIDNDRSLTNSELEMDDWDR